MHLHSATARAGARGKVAMFDPSQEYGVLPPVGFFDPLGLSKGISEEKFRRWRTVEIKHGRVAMMAFLGCTNLTRRIMVLVFERQACSFSTPGLFFRERR